ncbi:hypothetical protein C4588_04750 [Candidatus Parcubacteria bacterium]|nr:MAG: hypothetical protein C4588_04750 [Candidatus Parcubacteria bacterium]
MKQLLIDSTIMGGATLVSALALQKLYKVTRFYPPSPVFWFFMGFNAQLAIGLGRQLLQSSPPALSGFGETSQEINEKIKLYQKHISDLRRIVAGGTPAGRTAALKKISEEEKLIENLLAQRSN